MIENLKLTDKQATAVGAINLTYANKMHALRQKQKENKEVLKENKTAIQEEKSAEMEQILTEAQFATFNEIQEKRGKKKGNRRGKDKGGN